MTVPYLRPAVPPFLLGDAETFLRSPSQDPTAGPGVYGWCVGKPRAIAVVLYWGKSTDVSSRVKLERAGAEAFARNVADGWSRWEAAGNALSPVLAVHTDAYPVMWPIDGDDAMLRGHETALIRMSALHGGTPPAQGGGWDYWPQTPAQWQELSASARVAHKLMNRHFGLQGGDYLLE